MKLKTSIKIKMRKEIWKDKDVSVVRDNYNTYR